jgi:nitrosocyanin
MTKTISLVAFIIAVVLGGWWLTKGTAVAPAITDDAQKTETVATTTREQSSGEQSEAVTISGSEFKYEPATLSAKVGESVTVTYTNTGKYPHNFVIDELGVKSQTIKAGETATFTFTPSKAGTFSFYCSLPNHREKGMVGTLSVQ